MKKRTPAELQRVGVRIYLALVRKGPSTTEELCAALKLDFADVRLPLLKLRAEKSIKRLGKGMTRGTRYAVK